MNNKKSFVSNKFLNHIKRRVLYYTGSIFIFILPLVNVLTNLKIVTKIEASKTVSVNITWCLVGLLYLMFVAKFVRNKIHDMQPKPVKTFLSGLSSLIPVTVLGAFVNVVQELINKLPEVNVAKHIWDTVTLIAVGLILQIIDSVINRKYLYDLEIQKEAKKSIDIEKKKEQLIKARKEMEN